MSHTYTNPVYPHYFADPFVLRRETAEGVRYYAYGTGNGAATEPDGRWFAILTSTDLTRWDYVGGALEPLRDPERVAYWAPEVAERDGMYFLYYSAADSSGDQDHHLRVAVAGDPAGPFIDQGVRLAPQIGFSIDASPFRDPATGQWYLYFARDFFDARVGTGLCVAPLRDDMLALADEPRVVLRPQHDWQIYERNRHHYGRTWDAWHTVEGPFVVEHGGRYYCLYSGGSWQSPEYGVGFAVADHPLGPFRDDWNAHGPAVLRGIPGKVLGPGHNSVTLGPDGRTHYAVYHAWDAAQTGRRMCIDPLVWTADGPRCEGPTLEPQPAPAPAPAAAG